MKNLHWAITASDELVKNPGGGGVAHWAVDVQVKHLDTEAEAIKRAKSLIKRKHYFLRSVLECDCAQHNLQHRNQLEATRELTKVMNPDL